MVEANAMHSCQRSTNRRLPITTLVCVALCLFATTCLGQEPEENEVAREPARTFERAVIIEFEGAIDRRMLAYFERKLEAAKRYEADLVVVEIKSPGGGLDESLLIAEKLRDTDWATTVAHIPEMAISGAALISIGCDKIIMKPTARIGDAGVIFLDERFMFRYAPEKIMSDLVQRAKALAETNGYPPELAEAMIDRSAVVYEQTDSSGNRTFRTEYIKDENANAEPILPPRAGEQGEWNLVDGTQPNRFLVLSGTQAEELAFCNANVADRRELARTMNVNGDFKVYRYGSVDSAVYWLNRPLVTGLLFVIGMIALYMELSAPGISVGGLIAALCFGLFFWSRFLGGTAVVLELLLFILGVVFILLEIFVIPGTGLSGILGALLILGSLVMASQSFVIPKTTTEAGSVAKSIGVIIGSGLAFAFFAAVLSRYAGYIPVMNRFVLAPPTEAISSNPELETQVAVKKSGVEIAVGATGVADSVLRPAGKARFGHTILDVTADGDFVDVGQAIKVVEISGNRIVVRSSDA